MGSYLRPAELKEARAKFADGKISATDLRCIEDRLITEVIKQQKAHHLPYITDGEFRRSYWHLDFMWGFNGVEHIELEHGYQFHGEETTKGSIQLTGKITGLIVDVAEVDALEMSGKRREDRHRHRRLILLWLIPELP